MSKRSSETFNLLDRVLTVQATLQATGLLALLYHGAFPVTSLRALGVILLADLWLVASTYWRLEVRKERGS